MMNEPSRPKLSDDWQSQIEQACRWATLRLSFPSFIGVHGVREEKIARNAANYAESLFQLLVQEGRLSA